MQRLDRTRPDPLTLAEVLVPCPENIGRHAGQERTEDLDGTEVVRDLAARWPLEGVCLDPGQGLGHRGRGRLEPEEYLRLEEKRAVVADVVDHREMVLVRDLA